MNKRPEELDCSTVGAAAEAAAARDAQPDNRRRASLFETPGTSKQGARRRADPPSRKMVLLVAGKRAPYREEGVGTAESIVRRVDRFPGRSRYPNPVSSGDPKPMPLVILGCGVVGAMAIGFGQYDIIINKHKLVQKKIH